MRIARMGGQELVDPLATPPVAPLVKAAAEGVADPDGSTVQYSVPWALLDVTPTVAVVSPVAVPVGAERTGATVSPWVTMFDHGLDEPPRMTCSRKNSSDELEMADRPGKAWLPEPTVMV